MKPTSSSTYRLKSTSPVFARHFVPPGNRCSHHQFAAYCQELLRLQDLAIPPSPVASASYLLPSPPSIPSSLNLDAVTPPSHTTQQALSCLNLQKWRASGSHLQRSSVVVLYSRFWRLFWLLPARYPQTGEKYLFLLLLAFLSVFLCFLFCFKLGVYPCTTLSIPFHLFPPLCQQLPAQNTLLLRLVIRNFLGVLWRTGLLGRDWVISHYTQKRVFLVSFFDMGMTFA